jgi:hypothetical protein
VQLQLLYIEDRRLSAELSDNHCTAAIWDGPDLRELPYMLVKGLLVLLHAEDARMASLPSAPFGHGRTTQ